MVGESVLQVPEVVQATRAEHIWTEVKERADTVGLNYVVKPTFLSLPYCYSLQSRGKIVPVHRSLFLNYIRAALVLYMACFIFAKVSSTTENIPKCNTSWEKLLHRSSRPHLSNRQNP